MDLDRELVDQMIAWRRDFHRHAEPGWTEFRTTSIIARTLEKWGWDVVVGPDVHRGATRMGVPPADVLAEARTRALAQGADPELVERMGEGWTGVVATLDSGRPGPVVGFRFDIDANDLHESSDPRHRPTAQGFSSLNEGAMHGCGHDGHAAMGLGLARVLADRRSELTGSVRIIFQPAEEGVRGAHSIVEAGWLDDVDVFIATHLMAAQGFGHVCVGMDSFLASTKFDVTFTGVGAHAGANPEKGHNALLAACAATTNMAAIAPHSAGTQRVNVGTLNAGEGRNVVPRLARMQVECRGADSRINDYVFARARQVVQGAAQMFEVSHEIVVTGRAETAPPSPELLPFVHACFAAVPGVTRVTDTGGDPGSEDATAMMNRVKERGGLATYVAIGMDAPWGHHTEDFDIDEDCLAIGVAAESQIALDAAAFLKGLRG